MDEPATPQAFAEWVAGLPLDTVHSVADLVARAQYALGRGRNGSPTGVPPVANSAASYGPAFQSPIDASRAQN